MSTEINRGPLSNLPVVLAQPAQSRCTIVAFHAISGTLFHYRDLIACFPSDFGCYGFQARGLDGEMPPARSVRAMGLQYIEALESVPVSDVLIFLGWSFGGCIAHECARLQMAKSKRHRIGLVTIDTSAFKRYGVSSVSKQGTQSPNQSKGTTLLGRRQAELEDSHMAALRTFWPVPCPTLAHLNIEAGQRMTPATKVGDGNEWTAQVLGDHYSILKSDGVKHVSNLISNWSLNLGELCQIHQ